MEIFRVDSIAQVGAESWKHCSRSQYPFASYGFLAALEESGCVSERTGWKTQHLVVRDEAGKVVAVMPLYQKSHSWGEYVFDQEWAQAFARFGLRYYPKYVNAIPFSPVTGPRLLVKEDQQIKQVSALMGQHLLHLMEEQGLSSWHCLFPEPRELDHLKPIGALVRYGCQFHWFNRGYESFEHYLEHFTSRKRKAVRKERSALVKAGIQMHRMVGSQLSENDWCDFYRFYADTYFKRGHEPHLNLAFFVLLGSRLGDQIVVDWALLDGRKVAVALFLRDETTLYGRYWGCEQSIDGLHFEACFYRGIEYCIEHQLQRFDPGAQGEHKISRGFEPVLTYSAHLIKDERFRAAIADFVERERSHVERYQAEAATLLPFKNQECQPRGWPGHLKNE